MNNISLQDFLSLSILIVPAVFSSILLLQSVRSYSRNGPRISKDITDRYRITIMMSIIRQWFLCYLITAILIIASSTIVIGLGAFILGTTPPLSFTLVALSVLFTLVTICIRILVLLHKNPAAIAINSNISSKYWNRIKSIFPINVISILGISIALFCTMGILSFTQSEQHLKSVWILASLPALILFIDLMVPYNGHGLTRVKKCKTKTAQPNIIMIGCDTLRSDFIGRSVSGKSITPNIDKLICQSISFTNMFTPIARTAPSLATILTGQWPQTTRIIDNFTDPEQANLRTLSHALKNKGYKSSAHSDWSGSDFNRYDFGFDKSEAPPDQWNLNYLIKQGAKPFRLFLSLFAGGRIGHSLIPEIHYLAGVPLNQQVMGRALRNITEYSRDSAPFFINIFLSTAHPPFGSEYPFYNRYSKQQNKTESPFCMVKLTEPEDIIRSQKDPKTEFDLDQIIALYEGCVSNFDKRVGDLVNHLKQLSLEDNTSIVVYSDHGIDLFEKSSWGQGNTLDSLYSFNIPCIIKTPEKRQREIKETCSSVDLLPTLCKELKITLDHSMDGVAMSENYHPRKGLPIFLETGIWLAPPPDSCDGHLIYQEIDQLLTTRKSGDGTIIIKEDKIEEIEAAKDRAIIMDDWILVRKPLVNRQSWFLYNLSEDRTLSINLIEEQHEIFLSMKSLLEKHFNL